MIEQSPKEENLHIFRQLETNPNITQRDISSRLGISLGKTNYLLKELVKKGLIKAKSFSDNPGKIGKIRYMLTEKGIEEKIRLMYLYLKIKEAEYERLKDEWNKIATNLDIKKKKERI